MIKIATILMLNLFIASFVFAQPAMFSDNFEGGTVSPEWGLYWAGEENVTSIPMASAPIALETGGDYVALIHDLDASYNGAAIILAGDVSAKNYSIEGDVYCYANHPEGSAYTGLVVYADSAAGIYIKLVADFDQDQRLRLYNNKIDMMTFQYTFDKVFKTENVPGGIPAEDGWHKMKVEVQTIDDSTTAFWCYFDGEMLAGCPIYDTSIHQLDSGQFGLYAFQMDSDGVPGYFDNIEVKPLASVIFSEDFESGTASEQWGLYRANEETVVAVANATAPVVLENGGNYAGFLQDADGTYNGAAIALAGETTLANYSIEGDVYCYVNHSGGSAYTGLVAYADSAAGVYIKLVADFDQDQRLRLYNNKIDMTTFQYTFDHVFTAADIAGGIPTEDGWHQMKVEVQTVNDSTTAFWCYFDGEMLAGCPIYDTSKHQLDAGRFGLYAFQMDADGIAGYFDNIVVKASEQPTSVPPAPFVFREMEIKEYHLLQNFPNPFNPTTTISYRLEAFGFVELTVFDMLGREVRNLVQCNQAPGYYTVQWDALNEAGQRMPSGVYVYTLKTPGFTENRKMLLMK